MKKTNVLTFLLILFLGWSCESNEVKLEYSLLNKLKSGCSNLNEIKVKSILKLDKKEFRILEFPTEPPPYSSKFSLERKDGGQYWNLQPPCDFDLTSFSNGDKLLITGYLVEVELLEEPGSTFYRYSYHLIIEDYKKL